MTEVDERAGKRVGWVELYFDLVFVFAVGQVAHGIVADPHWARAAAALGLFATLWWTWIGFAVLYNRRGDDSRVADRLFVLAGTIPCGIAATQAHHVFEGHPAIFAAAMAGVRLILAAAHRWPRAGGDQRRIGWGYAVSAVLFGVSAVLPHYGFLWAFALVQEAGFLLLGDGRNRRRGERPTRAARWRLMLTPPRDPNLAVDSAHLAERFGLFMILLLGELVLTVGTAALERPADDLGYWLALAGGLVLAGALWWVYFSSAVEIYERMLGYSGGNPALAYSLYAGGHLMPAFALLLMAAGVNLSLHESPPHAAAWFTTAGLTIYLAGTRVFATGSRHWYFTLARVAALAATVNLALLDRVLPAPAVVLVIAGWAVGAAAVTAVIRQRTRARLGEDPVAFLRQVADRRRIEPEGGGRTEGGGRPEGSGGRTEGRGGRTEGGG
ncbi:Low temperature requirement protein LtrA [Amycolatopsis tolypomycina]|uniref:Low temperature requirement protein LtrA n=1 Tax=Amycolatopsis tolypomycina TaxID=208445 RepID=A0A1H4XIE7_9PSEU|nr:low temperature requirement protein A [Amycolatopsis tolypomycina]SED04920.1 Low temperature requirement protein LtrA [Amycolatopsis tolypomycina]